jgi:cellulose synthase operon protein B
MTSIKSLIGPAVKLGLVLLLCGSPLSAQVSSNAQDAPLIDFGAVLDAPSGAPATGTAAPAPTTSTAIAPIAAPTAPEIQDETLLTLPTFERGNSQDDPLETKTGEVLLPLTSKKPSLDGIVRLSGEVQSETFYIDLPQAAAITGFVMSYRVSINVLPDQSEMQIQVNGKDALSVRPDAFDGFGRISLPASLLADGLNEIVVTLHHTHRIFCGPDATFDVWTEINTNTSGARINRDDLPIDSVGIRMALSAQAAMAGNLPVRLINDPNTSDSTKIGRGNEAILEALSPRLAGLRGSSPIILAPEDAYGVITETAPLARITVMYGLQPSIEIRRGGDGTAVLLLTTGFNGELPELDDVLPFPGPLENNAFLRPGSETPLHELGFDQTNAYNHYTEQNLAFRLPDDWLLLASQKGLLRLDYSFLEGLPKGALMLVKLNDTTIRMLPLDIDGGTSLPTLDVGFRARLLRPGANLLTFATVVPGDPSDQPCAQTTAPFVTVDSGSTLYVPPSPKMQMSDLARPLAGIHPDQISADSPSLSDRSAAYFPSILASALRPISDTEQMSNASLHVTAEANDAGLSLNDLGINRRELLQLFEEPVGQSTATSADARNRPGLFDRLMAYVKDIGTEVRQLALPDDGPLGLWLAGKRADAVLFIPRDDAPEEVWLMVRPQSNPQTMAAVLAQARLSPEGPRGRLSILTSEGKWQSWYSSKPEPWMLEPLTVSNFRTVAGNYASWSPLFYGAILMTLTLISVGLALVYIVTTRGSRKR